MRRWFDLLLVSALMGLAAVLPLSGQGAAGQTPVSLKLDLDPAAPGIQSTRELALGTSFAVDVVAEGIPEDRPVGAFQFYLVYDDTAILAPEVSDDGTALDDNPDADQGALGTKGWDCSVFGSAFPVGDKDEASGPGHGRAFIGCLNPLGPFSATGSLTLATVRLNVVGSSGESDLHLEEAVVGDGEGAELGSCNPVTYFDAGCESGRVAIGQAVSMPAGEESPQAEASPAGTEETPAAEATPSPSSTPDVESGESADSWPWPGLGFVLAGLAAAALVAGAALYFRARLQGGR